MSAPRARWCLQQIGWPSRELARRLAVPPRVVRRWAAGQRDIPAVVAEWLEQLAAVHVRWPNPDALSPADAPPARSIAADRLRWIVAMIGWTETELAARMGRRAHKVAQLLAGDAELEQAEQQWLDALVAAHVASPLPIGWQRREDAPLVRCSAADGDDS